MEYIKLSDEKKIPILGYGACLVTREDCERCVLDAIEVGYRSIDTAQAYGNESEVGNALSSCGLDRSELFITTKIDTANYGYERTRRSFLESLEKLKSDYVDLCLLHQPFNDVYGSYRALEELYDEGLIRSIGVSNFYADRMVDIYHYARVKPVLNQLEMHPFHQRWDEQEWNGRYGICLEAWSPFGRGRENMLELPELTAIGERYGKTTAQVILRFLTQRGVAAVAKSTHKERMAENIAALDFTLTDDEMAVIKSLDKGRSVFYSHTDPEIVERFWSSIEKKIGK